MIKKYGMYTFILLLFIVASVMIYVKINPKELPANLIAATGKIDGDLITLNTKYSGRIRSIAIQEGQSIKKREVIATLSSAEYEKKLAALDAGIAAAHKALNAMRDELQITQTAVPLNIKKAHKALIITKAQKEELLSSIKTLKALLAQSQKDYERMRTLYEKNLISKHKLELTKLKQTSDQEKLAAMQARLQVADKVIEIAKEDEKIARSQEKKTQALQNKIAAFKDKIKALQANRDELQLVINELTIKSPINGYVIEKIANKGEVLGAGMVVATLIDPKGLYLKVFVDTLTNGKIKIGDKAVIFLDAYPNKAIAAQVTAIAANAEFTPKDVAIRSDRIQRVYAVHLKPLTIHPLLKLGIPAIGVISIDGKNLPESLNDIPSI